jgi:methyltransferase (TIGR00027 family)
MALFRAMETRRRVSERQFADTLAEEFLDGRLRMVARAAGLPCLGRLLTLFIDRRYPGPRPSGVARTRLIDEAVITAIGNGIAQLVILGAGYDSRAHRLPGVDRLTVFEVDHPDTQAVKRRVTRRVLGGEPAHVRYVAIDFDHQSLPEVAAQAGIVAGPATYFIWEGVLSYLRPDAVDATLRWAGDIAGPGSEIAMTYVHRGLLDRTVEFPHSRAWMRSVENAGEPFVFGFHPDELGTYLTARSWHLVTDLTTTEALVRYGMNPHGVPAFYRIAFARHEKADA